MATEINRPTEENGPRMVAEAIDMLDAQRLEDLKDLHDIELINAEILRSEKQRMKKKYGDGSDRVRDIDAKLSFNQEMLKALTIEIEKASIVQEPFDNKSWRLHGRVLDAQNKPLKGITVFFSDSNQNRIVELPSGCTDERGYYSLTLDENMMKKYKDQPHMISLADKSKKTIFSEKREHMATPGIMEFNDIVLAKNDCSF